MARRPIFVPVAENSAFYKEVDVEFKWNAGFAPIQKKKNITALHQSAQQKGYEPILEVSTKSDEAIGRELSAFNLPIRLDNGRSITLECAFQGGKVFEGGGPFQDLYECSSLEAKRDGRLRESGQLVGFEFEGHVFETEPKTAFYDWLYIKALSDLPNIAKRLSSYAGFSDIEFNPEKSINCQARACALFVGLSKKHSINEVIHSPEAFLRSTMASSLQQPHSQDFRQQELF